MKRYSVKFIFLSVFIWMGVCQSAFAFFDDADASAALWVLINDARAHPLQILEKYGIPQDEARDILQDDGWILDLENGLPPLARHTLLDGSAAAHNQDMVDRAYYDYTTLDENWQVDDRIKQQGYGAETSGESLELLFFYLYMDPMAGVADIFENMVRGEFSRESRRPRNIFNPRFSEIGLSFISTQFAFEGVEPFNAYIVTVDFATPVENRSYLMGTIARSTAMDSSCAMIQTVNGTWCPDEALDEMSVVVKYIVMDTWRWSTETENLQPNKLSFFQVPMDTGMFYSLEINDALNGDLLGRKVGVESSVNQWCDIVLP